MYISIKGIRIVNEKTQVSIIIYHLWSYCMYILNDLIIVISSSWDTLFPVQFILLWFVLVTCEVPKYDT